MHHFLLWMCLVILKWRIAKKKRLLKLRLCPLSTFVSDSTGNVIFSCSLVHWHQTFLDQHVLIKRGFLPNDTREKTQNWMKLVSNPSPLASIKPLPLTIKLHYPKGYQRICQNVPQFCLPKLQKTEYQCVSAAVRQSCSAAAEVERPIFAGTVALTVDWMSSMAALWVASLP